MPLSGKEAIKVLRKHGFTISRQNGSHAILIKKLSTHKIITVVPMHKELKKGTLRSIAKQSGVNTQDFGL